MNTRLFGMRECDNGLTRFLASRFARTRLEDRVFRLRTGFARHPPRAR
jgi:3-phenylpropionate/cinnamic acid dioxygenase small subunit